MYAHILGLILVYKNEVESHLFSLSFLLQEMYYGRLQWITPILQDLLVLFLRY